MKAGIPLGLEAWIDFIVISFWYVGLVRDKQFSAVQQCG
jgi:hypothetical protein